MAPFFSFLLLAVPMGIAQDAPGFQFLGYGYDALQGNPLDTTGYGDIGFRTNVFVFTNTTGQRTPDGRWAVPDKTTTQAVSACSMQQLQNTINSEYSYQKQLSTSAGLSGGYSGVEFGFSIGSKHVRQTTDNNQSIFSQISSLCSVYKLTMHIYDHPEVDSNFVAAVASLPLQYDEKSYMKFLRSFGTHVVTAMILGGRWGWQMEFKLDDWKSLLNDSIDISTSLSYAGKVEAGLKIGYSVDTKIQSRVMNSISKNSSFSIGGDFKPDMDEWRQSVSAQPMPVHVTLTEITDLFTDSYLRNGSNLSTKKANMATALTNYCHYLSENVDTSVSCTPPKPIPMPTPTPSKDTIRGVCVKNGGGYVMLFDMYIDGSSHSATSGHFPIGEDRCVDAEEVDAHDGDVLRCRVHIDGGKSPNCPGFGYKFSALSKLRSHYKCWGTTLFPNCEFVGLSQNGVMMAATREASESDEDSISDVSAPMLSSVPSMPKRVEGIMENIENLIV